MASHRVVIVGGGFGGLNAARELGRDPRVAVTLVDVVGRDLAIPGHPGIFAIGDDAVQPWKKDRPVPGVAQGAIQPGQYVGKAIRRRLSGEPVPPFRFRDKGDVAVIGRLATGSPLLPPIEQPTPPAFSTVPAAVAPDPADRVGQRPAG
jgi:NADH dehydrogenase